MAKTTVGILKPFEVGHQHNGRVGMHHLAVVPESNTRKKYQLEKVPSGLWYFLLRKKYNIGIFSFWYIFLYNRKKYHNILIVIGKSTIHC